MPTFRPATRTKSRLRMAIDGVSGSGKTFTALRFAAALGKKIAVINSESGAVEKYLGLAPDGVPFQFDVCELDDFAPTKYTEAILAAGQAGYDVLVIDSLSHAWSGSGGALELKDRKGGNSFTAWKDITPMHNQMVESILRSPCHVIVTMRSKTEYVLEADGNGRMVPRKMGMAPIQRAGMEYEFDLYCSIDSEHILKVSKSRCPELADATTVKPGATFIEPIRHWLEDGSEANAESFAVTAEDLKRFEARQEADNPQPAKSPQELMQEAAERAAKQQAGGDDKPVEQSEASKPTESKPSQEAKPSVESIADQPGGSDHVDQVDVNGPCLQSQVDAIKRGISQWEQEEPGVTERFIKALHGAGFGKIAELSYRQAEDLLADIGHKETERFFDSQLRVAS